MSATHSEPRPIEVVITELIEDAGGALVRAGESGALPRDVLDASQDFIGALKDTLQAGEQLVTDRTELEARRDVLPDSGYEKLMAAADRAAIERTREAENAAERAYDSLVSALEREALPQLDPSREALARDEASLALSVDGDAGGAARALASSGSWEAVSALLSPWGRQLIAARGVERPEAVLAEARAVAVDRAVRESGNPAAVALRDHMPRLGAAKGNAGNRVRHLANWKQIGRER